MIAAQTTRSVPNSDMERDRTRTDSYERHPSGASLGRRRTIRRSDLEVPPLRLLSSGRNRTKADVSLHRVRPEPSGSRDEIVHVSASAGDHEEPLVVVKDFAPRGFVVRSTLGRFSTAREARAYARLEGVRGIPSFHGRLDTYALAMAFVPGGILPEHPRHTLPSSFFDALEELVASVHARGVAIADLHHRNVIVRHDDGSPALVDFSLSVAKPAAWNLPGLWLFARACRLDRLALGRIRDRYMIAQTLNRRSAADGPGRGGDPARGTPSGAEAHGGSGSSRSEVPLYAFGRAIKRLIRRVQGRS